MGDKIITTLWWLSLGAGCWSVLMAVIAAVSYTYIGVKTGGKTDAKGEAVLATLSNSFYRWVVIGVVAWIAFYMVP